LPWLHKLSQMFAHKREVKALLDARDAQALYEAVAAAEAKVNHAAK